MVKIGRNNADRFAIGRHMQRGVFVSCPAAENLVIFVTRLLRITAEDVNRELKTIMMDGMVVDTPGDAQVLPGSTIVLSGAMPGLVGAMLRSNSPYKAMRETITSQPANTANPNESNAPSNLVKVKLLNTVLSRHKQDMINTGFWIDEE